MKKGVILYYLTGGWALLTVAIGAHFLMSSMEPTADVKSSYQARLHTIPIVSWAPGEIKRLVIRGKPVVIWRRSPTEMATAMSQADASIPLKDWAEVLNDGSLANALGPEEFARVEWLIVSPISPAGLGCIVLAQAGDYHGFFDPCRGVHFDMWGRPQKGPSHERLITQLAYLTEDQQALVLDTSQFPLPK